MKYATDASSSLATRSSGDILQIVQGGVDKQLPVDKAGTTAIIVACSDEITNLTTGTAKITFRMPYAMQVEYIRASLTAAQTAGSLLTVDVNEGGTTILSTKLTFDNNEKTTTTAATPAVVSDANLADDAEITIDIDQVGTAGAKGLKVAIVGRRV